MTGLESRYHRQLVMPSIGVAGQDLLEQASVVCVGAGGLASSMLLCLAAAGVGRIGIVDDDVLEMSNLNRQILYQEQDLGKYKAELAADKLRLFNANIEVRSYVERFHTVNAKKLLQGYDYVVDCGDNQATSILLNDWCYHLGKAFIFSSISQFSGMLASFDGKHGPCLRCWSCLLAERGQDCAVDGILGSVASIFGSLQANEVIKAIVSSEGRKNLAMNEANTNNRMLLFDTAANKMQSIEITKNSDCRACQQRLLPESESIEAYADSISADFDGWRVIDIRPYAATVLRGSLKLDGDQVLDCCDQWLADDRTLVVCQRGIRSRTLVQQLRRLGFYNAYSLAGGSEGQAFSDLINKFSG